MLMLMLVVGIKIISWLDKMSDKKEAGKTLAKKFRKELSTIMSKMGFKISVTTKYKYWETDINVTIKEVPKNFPVWEREYSTWDKTEKAKRLRETIESRFESIKENHEFQIYMNLNVMFDSNIPYIEIS